MVASSTADPQAEVTVSLTRQEILDLLAAVILGAATSPNFDSEPLSRKLGDALRRVEAEVEREAGKD